MYRSDFMEYALSLSARALDVPGTEPFAAVIVKNGAIVGEGINQSLLRFDPTSHGEIEAIRDACKNLKSLDLTGCEIYTSCEACALCVAAIKITGISAMYYAASLDRANDILSNVPSDVRPAVDVVELRREAGSSISGRGIRVHQALPDKACEILQSWAGQKK